MGFQEGLINISVVLLVFTGMGYLLYAKILNDNPIAAEKIKNFSFKGFIKEKTELNMKENLTIQGGETLM